MYYPIRQFIIILFLFLTSASFAQEVGTVIDFDGNVYTEIQIGNQTWLKENIKSLHYSDGTEIPNVASYNDDPAMADTYGRLYTWQAAMRSSTEEGAQGVAPDGYHVASDAEWTELENFLGGANAAGGKMKEVGTDHWNAPNSGATNSSGFTALPAGEYDAHYTPNIFRLLNEYAVFWTSTQISATLARERYISFDSQACEIYDWYKVMKYSVRCVKNSPTAVEDEINRVPTKYELGQNYPNPFNPSTIIPFSLIEEGKVTITIFDTLGRKVKTLVDEVKPAGSHSINFDAEGLSSGLYLYKISANGFFSIKKMQLVR